MKGVKLYSDIALVLGTCVICHIVQIIDFLFQCMKSNNLWICSFHNNKIWRYGVWSFPIIWRLFDKKNIIDKRLNMHVQSSCTHCTVSFTLFTQIKRLKKVIWHIRTCIWPNSCLIKTNKIDFLACNIIFLQQRTDINIFPIHIHATFRRRITSFHVLYFK